MPERALSKGEEIANSISHGVGFLGSLAALPVLVIAAASRHDAWQVVGGAIFGAALILLYGASTLYHALSATRAKYVFRVLDHGAIYFLIAGTYTPFTLGALRGPWGWALLGTIWALAATGIVLKATPYGFRFPKLSTAIYLLMGWLVVAAVKPLVAHVAAAGLAWLVAGGLFYTAGILFFALDHRRYLHMVWHLFVLGGSVCHFVAVLWYANGRAP